MDGDTLRCGFKIGGGIDQDFHKSPQGYTDNVTNTFYFYIPKNYQNKYICRVFM